MGWAAVHASLSTAPLLLYAGSIAWVVGYDTIYALQDIEDDEIVGIKSSARYFGSKVRAGVAACYGLTVPLIAASLYVAGARNLAWLGLLAFAAHLAFQVRTLDRRNGARALRLFRSNRTAGLLLTAGIAAEAFLRAS
jgi:4-hydroxybenzoate polyprenyltransferase